MRELDIRTYVDYIKLKDVNTKQFLMISELIDNAIGSFDNHYNGGDWETKLKIDIAIYMDHKPHNIEDLHGYNVSKNSYLIVRDNAFGMNEEQLFYALKLNSKNTSTKSKMNIHGRGLKQCAFYFGTDLVVETNDGNSSWKGELKFSDQEGPSSQVEIITTKGRLENMGTIIKISNIHSNRLFKSGIKWGKTKDALSQRYIKLIESGKLEIRLSEKPEVRGSEIKSLSKSKNDAPIKISDDYNYDEERINKIIDVSREIFEKKIKKSDDTRFNESIKEVKEAFQKISSLLIRGINDKELKFQWEQEIEIGNNKSVKVFFWKLPKGLSAYKGLRVYEGNRAIMHPPIVTNEFSTYLSPLPRTHGTGSTDNTFAGMFWLDDINAQTTTDKSNFNFESESEKELFDAKVHSIWMVFDIFVLQGRSSLKNEKGVGLSSKDIEKIVPILNTKFNKEIDEVSFINDKLIVSFHIEDEIWRVSIGIDSRENPPAIYHPNYDFDDFSMNLTIFTGHSLWKNIDKNKDFSSEALYPISILLAYQDLSFRNKIRSLENNSKFSDEKLEEISPFNIINKGGKNINNG